MILEAKHRINSSRFVLLSAEVCDNILIGLRTSGGCPCRDVVSSHPAENIQTVWVVWLEEVPGGDEYPTPLSKL